MEALELHQPQLGFMASRSWLVVLALNLPDFRSYRASHEVQDEGSKLVLKNVDASVSLGWSSVDEESISSARRLLMQRMQALLSSYAP